MTTPTSHTKEYDRHVVPEWQDHETAATCWCNPVVDYVDAVNGGRVWVHRTANDAPHYVPEEES